MAKELSLLIPAFRIKVQELVKSCAARNTRIEPYLTIITPIEQASLWKQGRSVTDAELKAMALDQAGAKYLAKCIRTAPIKDVNLVTDFLPGYSWHQWGEMCSCAWVDSNSKLNWSPLSTDRPTGSNGYAVFAEEAKKLGLTHGCDFGVVPNARNWTLVQNRPERSPSELYKITEIDAEMFKRYPR